jgi:probable phosphoglycerate mutase
VTPSPNDETTDAREREYRQYRFTPPSGATDLLLVRHGESAPASEARPAVLLNGHADPPLDPVGQEQAQRLADRVALEPLDAIYVTSLRRTAETAAPLAERLGITPVVEPDLREVYLGEWEGAAFRRHTSEGHPIAKQMIEQQRWDVIPGAEPIEQFRTRVERGISRIAVAHPNQRVMAVVHGGVIGMILAIASGSRNLAFTGVDNASISQIVVLGDQWIVRRFNDTTHLETAYTLTPTALI